MAQHDYNLANQSGADFRADLNNALSAIVTVNSGATAPSTTFSHQLWVDTSSNVLKIRNAANDAWVTTGVSITADNTFAGNLTGNVTGNLTGDVTGNADTATALETARTINGASFDGTANISFDTDSVSEGSSNLYYTSARFDSAFSGKSTSDLTEGTNLYYTDARFDTRLATKDTDDLTEGTNLYFTNARVESYLDAGTATPTFASAVINTSLTGSAILDDDTFGTASATTVATSESIKAYVDSQVGTVDTLSEILANGNTTGGTDIAFGDNDKATFGNSDLEIYHSGTHSIIADVGTGDLLLRGNNARLQNSDGSATFIHGFNGGEVQVNYAGNTKLATTSTGIDVTGTVVSDGLTVDGNAKLSNTDGTTLRLEGSGASSGNLLGRIKAETSLALNGDNPASIKFVSAGTSSGYHGGRIQLYTTNKDVTGELLRLNVAENGDISFYDDTGSTQGLFWDASTESLGIGTTSPDSLLHIKGGDTSIGTLKVQGGKNTVTSVGEVNSRLDFGSNDGSVNSTGNVGGRIASVTEISNGANTGLAFSTFKQGTGLVEYLRLTNDGSVGIGTDSPNARLESYVSGNFSTTYNDFSGDGLYIQTNGTVADGEYTAGISFSRTAGNNARVAGIAGVQEGSDADKTGLAFFTHSSTGTTDALQESIRISADGSVGIGTDSPDTKMHISDTAGNAIIRLERNDITISTNDIYGEIQFEGQDASAASAAGVRGKILGVSEGTTGDMAIAFHTAGSYSAATEALRIDSSQNLLVGKTAASSYTAGFQTGQDGFTAITRALYSPLVVNRLTNNGTIIDIRKDSTTVGSIGVETSGFTIDGEAGHTGLQFGAAGIIPRDNGSNTDGTNDLGASPHRFRDLHLSGGLCGDTTFKNSANTTEYARFNSSGNLLVGTTAGSFNAKITAEHTSSYTFESRRTGTGSEGHFVFRNANGAVGTIFTNGSATAYNTSSDARLKDVTGEARGLEVITKLNPVAYNWKADGKADEGLIAQEVKELVPNAVTGSENEHYQMDYSKLVTHLVKAVQELEQQTIELKKEIANLKGE